MITETAGKRMVALIMAANGKRRIRTLSVPTVEGLVRTVQRYQPEGPCCWLVRVGGSVKNAYARRALTTIALSAKVDGVVYLGVTTCDAHGPSPGRAWPVLKPWARGNMPDKIRAWAGLVGTQGVIRIDEPSDSRSAARSVGTGRSQ